MISICFFFFQAEDGIRDKLVTGVQTCALPIWSAEAIESLRPGEQECGFVRERWVPINRLTRRCRSTSGAHRLPLSTRSPLRRSRLNARIVRTLRSEEHTSELQSLAYLVCRLLLEKKKNKQKKTP